VNKKISAAVAVALIGASAPVVNALELSNLTARVRVVHLEPADKSGAIAALGAPADTIDVEDKWIPDLDFEYALTDHVALELLLTIPQKHDVVARETALGDDVALGTVTHLPPTLTAKYYFSTGAVKPYVGAGVNLTWFVDDNLGVAGVGTLDVDNWSIGPALQAGVDVTLNPRWSLSFDAKRAWISTDVSLGGAKLTKVKVDPWIVGAGVGYRFGN
jgi:outer membrane protein